MKKISKICKEPKYLNLNSNIRIILFPEKRKDVIRLDFKKPEKEFQVYLTPEEILELSSALNITIQHYLQNQEQYRKDVLGV